MNATPMAPWWLTFNQCFSESSGCMLQNFTYAHTIHTRPFCIYIYIHIYTCTSVRIHAVVIVVSNLQSFPVHSAMKRERVIANAALWPAAGKFKALLAWPTPSFPGPLCVGNALRAQLDQVKSIMSRYALHNPPPGRASPPCLKKKCSNETSIHTYYSVQDVSDSNRHDDDEWRQFNPNGCRGPKTEYLAM